MSESSRRSFDLSLPDDVLVERLMAFERRVADAFNAGEIRAPVHLTGGNERELIAYFRENYNRARGDWICTTWRSHYHCLLAGVDPERVFSDILTGRSITLTYPDRRVVSSAIVGGVLPIALGLATAIERRGEPAVVHAFVGDMTARTGAFWECLNYAQGRVLPIRFVVEDNRKSVGTPTDEVWGGSNAGYAIADDGSYDGYVTWYRYELPWPHAGAGQWVRF